MDIKEQPPEEKEAKDVPNQLTENKESLITSEMNGNENSEKTQAATIWVDNSETELTEDEQIKMIDEMRQSELIEAIVEKAIKKSMEDMNEIVKKTVNEAVANNVQEDKGINHKKNILWLIWAIIIAIITWCVCLITNNSICLWFWFVVVLLYGVYGIRYCLTYMWPRSQDVFRGAILSSLLATSIGIFNPVVKHFMYGDVKENTSLTGVIIATSEPNNTKENIDFLGRMISTSSEPNVLKKEITPLWVGFIILFFIFIWTELWLDKRNKKKNDNKTKQE